MPEGHTIHRLARLHRRALRGRTVRVTSPQGRFAGGAALLDGRISTGVDAYGKHLFYRWSDGPTLHVHLGLYGKFRGYGEAAPLPTAGTRLAMATDDATLHLAGPTACELLDPGEERRLRERLGPDPLGRRPDPAAFLANLARRTLPIGAALLDQRVVAGIGNVYRSELLFLCRIHPDRPARSLTDTEASRLWAATVAQLRAGERAGRIVTVDPADVGRVRAWALPADQRVYVYKRAGLPCRRCGTTVVSWELAARTISACPTCQPAP